MDRRGRAIEVVSTLEMQSPPLGHDSMHSATIIGDGV